MTAVLEDEAEFEVKDEVEEVVINHADTAGSDIGGDDELKEIQAALADSAENGDLPAGVSTLLGRVGLYLGTVSDQLNGLAHAVQDLADSQASAFDEVNDRLYRVCNKLNIRTSSGRASSRTERSTRSRSRRDSERSKDESSSQSKRSVDGERSSRRDSGHTSANTVAEKYPNIVIIGSSSTPEPWDPGYKFAFKVGDLVFDSLEQALFYVKYAFMKRPDLAARVKKAESVVEIATASNIAHSEEWDAQMHDAAMSLLQMKVMQLKEFEEQVQSADSEKTYILASKDAVLGSGNSAKSLIALGLPDKYSGKNLYGTWIREFIQRYELGLPDALPFDCKKYCTFESMELDPEKHAVLVLGDVNLSGFVAKYNTKLIVDPTMSAISHPRDDKHTAKAHLENLETSYLQSCKAVVLLFGTYEVGKGPDKLEGDYASLIKDIRKMAPDAGIFIGTAMPRTDKFQDQVKMTNYAIGIVARTCDDPKVQLLDLHEKFMKISSWKTCLRPNGFQLNLSGADKLSEALAYNIPFMNLVSPKPVEAPSRPASDDTARYNGPPPFKRRRAGVYLPRSRGVTRGSSGFYSGGGLRMRGGGYSRSNAAAGSPSNFAASGRLNSGPVTASYQTPSAPTGNNWNNLSSSGMQSNRDSVFSSSSAYGTTGSSRNWNQSKYGY